MPWEITTMCQWTQIWPSLSCICTTIQTFKPSRPRAHAHLVAATYPCRTHLQICRWTTSLPNHRQSLLQDPITIQSSTSRTNHASISPKCKSLPRQVMEVYQDLKPQLGTSLRVNFPRWETTLKIDQSRLVLSRLQVRRIETTSAWTSRLSIPNVTFQRRSKTLLICRISSLI